MPTVALLKREYISILVLAYTAHIVLMIYGEPYTPWCILILYMYDVGHSCDVVPFGLSSWG